MYGFNSKYADPTIDFAFKRAFGSETYKEGLEQGLEIGLEKGREEGSEVKALAIAKSMLSDGLSKETVIKYTGLTEEQVAELSKA